MKDGFDDAVFFFEKALFESLMSNKSEYLHETFQRKYEIRLLFRLSLAGLCFCGLFDSWSFPFCLFVVFFFMEEKRKYEKIKEEQSER